MSVFLVAVNCKYCKIHCSGTLAFVCMLSADIKFRNI